MQNLQLSTSQANMLIALLEHSTAGTPASQKIIIGVSLHSSITPLAVHNILDDIAEKLTLST